MTQPSTTSTDPVQVRVFRHKMPPAQVARVVDLLRKAGCASTDITVIDSQPKPLPLGEDEVLVVVLTPDALADDTVISLVKHAQSGGRRAVCIWPDGADLTSPPDWAQKFAYSTPTWDAEELRKVLANDDAVCVQTSGGKPLEVQTDHRICEELPA